MAQFIDTADHKLLNADLVEHIEDRTEEASNGRRRTVTYAVLRNGTRQRLLNSSEEMSRALAPVIKADPGWWALSYCFEGDAIDWYREPIVAWRVLATAAVPVGVEELGSGKVFLQRPDGLVSRPWFDCWAPLAEVEKALREENRRQQAAAKEAKAA